MLRRATGLQTVRIGADQVVLKRGVDELLLSGTGVATVVETVLQLLDGTRTADEIAAGVAEELRDDAATLLRALRRRRMLVETPVDAPWHDDSAQSRFYVNFGVQPGQVMDRLRAARVVIYGRNGISRVLAASLLDMHIGRVTLVDDPTLADPEAGREWPDRTLAPFDGHDGVRDSAVADARLTVLEGAGPVNVADTTVLCATSDFGMSQRLLDINQAALEGRTPFLPVWLQDLVGYVGPLVYPFDTACLRCYRLRVDANDERYEITNAVREHMATHLEARPGTGFLPAMTGALGYVAAVEIVKSVSGFAPADAIGRSIELNLVSFGSTVRRVLKVPRCPACSPVMQRTTRVLTTGPQIPHRT